MSAASTGTEENILTRYEKWFTGYTENMRRQVCETYYDEKQPLIVNEVLDEFDMKVQHTYFVRENCEGIAGWLDLQAHDFTVASLCGLFHDLGRFEQALHYGTMDDRITGSHADLSERVFMEQIPKDGLSERDTEVIATALRCHNLFRLSGGLSNEEALFAKIVRDADKLDIFRHVIDSLRQTEKRVFRFVHYQQDSLLDPSLYEAVMRGENLHASKVHTKQDRMLLEISLIYDLNYGWSFQRTLDMKFMEARTTGEKEELKEPLRRLYEYANRYMKERVTQR